MPTIRTIPRERLDQLHIYITSLALAHLPHAIGDTLYPEQSRFHPLHQGLDSSELKDAQCHGSLYEGRKIIIRNTA